MRRDCRVDPHPPFHASIIIYTTLILTVMRSCINNLESPCYNIQFLSVTVGKYIVFHLNLNLTKKQIEWYSKFISQNSNISIFAARHIGIQVRRPQLSRLRRSRLSTHDKNLHTQMPTRAHSKLNVNQTRMKNLHTCLHIHARTFTHAYIHMRTRKYANRLIIFSVLHRKHTFAYLSNTRGKDFLVYVSFLRTLEKQPEVSFQQKDPLFRSLKKKIRNITLVSFCNPMKNKALKSVNNFSSYKRTNTNTLLFY